MRKDNIILIGFMGTGKTTIGKLLAKKLSMGLIDTDILIETIEGLRVADIFDTYGEAYFRGLEERTIRGLAIKKHTVIATGGGVIINPVNRELLKGYGQVVLLDASVDTIIKRLRWSRKKRPLLLEKSWEKKVERLMAERKALYKDCAEVIVSIDGKGPLTIANEIIRYRKKADT